MSFVRLFATSLFFIVTISASNSAECKCIDWVEKISSAELESIRYVPIPADVTAHPFEKRGFVEVPLDYSRADSPKIKIFYRLLPVRGSTVNDTTKPILVSINGGPGISSAYGRAVDFDYQNSDAKQNENDRFKFLSESFRILMIDQRGTGFSAPLEPATPPYISPAIINQYFGPNLQALDHAEVIKKVIPKGEAHFLNGQSYGGRLMLHYLAVKDRPTPTGIIFSSSALPFRDGIKASVERRQSQLTLNLQLQEKFPDISVRLDHLREHFRENGFPPESVNHLWMLLGKGPEGVWQEKMVKKITELQAANRKELKKFIDESAEGVSLLNYVLSSAILHPGFTDLTMSEEVDRLLPLERWMINEQWTLVQVPGGDRVLAELLNEIDKTPPPEPSLGQLNQVRRLLYGVETLFTFGEGDAFTPKDTFLPLAQAIGIKKHSTFTVLPGGHSALYWETGHKAVLEWIRDKKLDRH